MTRRAISVVALVAFALMGASACGSSSKPKVAPVPTPVDLRGQKAVTIDAKGNQFTPASVIVDVDTLVTWTNSDTVVHNVKKGADAVDFGAAFGTDVFNPGQSYSFRFPKAGTFFYTCTIHTLMDGKVQVVASAAATTTTTPLGPVVSP